MNAAVLNEPTHGFPSNFPSDRIKSREDHGSRGVIDQDCHARRSLERAYVAAFATDDAALDVIAGQCDRGSGRIKRVFAGKALDG